MTLGEFFEILMIVLFGLSWPVNVFKSYKSRTAKGKSLMFLLFILSGYVIGIIGKFVSGSFKIYVVFFYFLNAFMVLLDILLYFRNHKLDEKIDNE